MWTCVTKNFASKNRLSFCLKTPENQIRSMKRSAGQETCSRFVSVDVEKLVTKTRKWKITKVQLVARARWRWPRDDDEILNWSMREHCVVIYHALYTDRWLHCLMDTSDSLAIDDIRMTGFFLSYHRTSNSNVEHETSAQIDQLTKQWGGDDSITNRNV